MKETIIDDLALLNLVIMSNSTNIIRNPYLVAKYVEILFTSCSMIQPQASYFNKMIINYPNAENYLISALMKFYSGIKFNISFLNFESN
jgi:hypothetical protein